MVDDNFCATVDDLVQALVLRFDPQLNIFEGLLDRFRNVLVAPGSGLPASRPLERASVCRTNVGTDKRTSRAGSTLTLSYFSSSCASILASAIVQLSEFTR
jgi:hypothetical protein